MYIASALINGETYIRLVESVRQKGKSGKIQSRPKTILNLGNIKKYDDGKPNFLERLRKSFKEGNPIIPELQEYVNNQRKEYKLTENKSNIGNRIGHCKKVCNIILERLIEELGLDRLFATMKNASRIKYDVYGFFKILMMGRILEPSSKIDTVKQNDEYYEPILEEGCNKDNVYDTLTFIGENKDKIIRCINGKLQGMYKTNRDRIYYDVTNFYFETDREDRDIYDYENGEIITGLRKKGVSKEHRPSPIVQMGLFMDNEGMPISIEMFSGNKNDQSTLRTALNKNIDKLEFSRFVLVSDRGIYNQYNAKAIKDGGNGYILSKSLLKHTNEEERQWAYEQEGYIQDSEDFKYKSRIVTREIQDKEGNKAEIKEKVIVYWSKKYYDRIVRGIQKEIEYMQSKQDKNGNIGLSVTDKEWLSKHLKEDKLNIETGKTIEGKKLKTQLDYEKIKKEIETSGYYQIVTSELEMDDKEVIEKYKGLTRLEEQFRIMKSTLETRPMYVWTPEHIQAHLIICLIALIMIRMIQRQLKEVEKEKMPGKGNINKDLLWHNVLSADRIQEALKKFHVDAFSDNYYQLMDIDYPDLDLLIKAFKIVIPDKIFIRRGDLKSMKSSISLAK